ncbi:Helix-turn-helix domain-containing protein [Chromobacterium vaccinii]|nr:Helix-turn-helix domain-containing protein [Chromobacterium vaccinii]QND89817.1 Helix-turn-helix domain-containing protein [Chromobacterium vaccinii]
MSIKLMSRAWDMDIPTGQKMILIALADRANDEGECWPGQEELAKKGSMSPRSVVNHIDWLEDHGLLKVERRQKGNQRQSNRYTVTLDSFIPGGGVTKLESADSAHAAVAHANPAHARVAPPKVQSATGESANSAHSFNEEPSKNHQVDPSLLAPGAADAKSKTITAKGLHARGVDAQHAADFLAIRKAKRAPLTPTAMAGIEREAAIAGLTLAQAIQISAERGWQGFKAEWLQRDTPQSSRPAGGKPTLAEQNRAAAEAARKLLFGDDPVEV